MVKSKRKMKKNTREKIMDAAEDLFAEQGYEAASLGDVADRVGIRQPSIFQHFPTKKDLYMAVMIRVMDPWLETIDMLADEILTIETARLMTRRWVTYLAQHPNMARLINQAALNNDWQLDFLVERWFQRSKEHVYEFNFEDSDYWQHGPEKAPWVMMAITNMMLGYITLSHLYEKVFGLDPLSKDAVETQVEFFFTFIERGLVKPEFHGRDRAAKNRD